MVKKEDENMGRNDDQEFKQLGEEYDDDYIDSIPSRSQSRRANKSKKAIFRYPILNLLIIFFLLIPIVCLGVYLFVLNFGSNSEDKVTTENAQTETTTKPKEVNIASNEEKLKEAREKAAADAKAKEAADKKAALEKQQAEEAKKKEEEAQKAAAQKAEQDRIAAAKAEETRKQEAEAAAQKAEQDRLAAEARQKEEDEAAKAAAEAKAKASHTVVAGDTLYKIARQAYGNSNVAANVAKIKQANGITNDNVPIGTVLRIPQ